MNRLFSYTITVLTVAWLATSAMAETTTTSAAIQQVADMLEVELVGSIERTEIQTSDGVLAHYTATLTVGGGLAVPIDTDTLQPIVDLAGPYVDTIRIHRVVKETSPGVPAETESGILCSGGDLSTFNVIYMPSTLTDPTGQTSFTLGQIIGKPDHSLGIYLAKNGMDVWGIDWRWATIPMDEPPVELRYPDYGPDYYYGLGYMNTDTHLDDFELTLQVARLTRGLTGQGNGRMYVTGFSRGAYMAVALADRQAVYSGISRDIKGIIPVDFPIKSDDPNLKQTGCDRIGGYDHVMAGNGGVYPPFNDPSIIPPFFNPTGMAFIGAAYDSLTKPEGINQLFGVSNKNVYDIFTGATWFPFHLIAGGAGDWQWSFNAEAPIVTLDKFDANNPYSGVLPFPVVFPNPLFSNVPDTDMLYTNYTYMQLASFYIAPFQSYGEQRDSMVCLCEDTEDSPYDDNLDKIHVPVLLVDADGGAIAGSSDETLSRLGSEEKEILRVSGSVGGYGHADLYFADDADTEFWQPMLDWLLYRGE